MDTNKRTSIESFDIAGEARRSAGRMGCHEASLLAMTANRAFHELFVPKTQISCEILAVRAGVCRIPEATLSTNTG
jgi:hypothetical protein